MKQKGFVLLPIILIIAILGLSGLFFYQNNKTNSSINELKQKLSNEVATSAPTQKPTSTTKPTTQPTTKPTPKVTNSPTSTPSPAPKPFAEEESMMRKTIAGFEMYIGTGNTAGALTFFTAPKTASAKARYEEIKGKNLPYGLKSWTYVTDSNSVLAVETINGGYKVRMNECRSNSSSCLSLTLEMVRDSKAENGFMIERYYGSEYMYQNNLGEEIKYKGFSF